MKEVSVVNGTGADGERYKTDLLSCPALGNCSIRMKDLTAFRMEKLCWF